jgi:hypothetical protein
MTGFIAYQIAWTVLTAGQIWLWLTKPPRPYLALACGVLASASILTHGIIERSGLVIGLGAFDLAIAVALLLWWNGRGKHRKRVGREIGDESRQVRDGLVRRAREAGSRRSPSPSPRVSP